MSQNSFKKNKGNGLNLYDSDTRFYDPVIPRTPTADLHSENYYPWSPYAWVGNNPINAFDPNGQDSYLLIWFSDDDETGHAGIAVDNYKQQQVMDENGKPVLDSEGNLTYEMVKDGTMTYYDYGPTVP